MEERLGNCLLLLLQAEMAENGSRKRRIRRVG
jgi:hypothetical protein